MCTAAFKSYLERAGSVVIHAHARAPEGSDVKLRTQLNYGAYSASTITAIAAQFDDAGGVFWEKVRRA